ncbi:DUF7561 family protein [Halobacterium noricense]|uniref:DUF7561 family protein n=1 Tax=Halobacterium noricense TaxID=223182 RepID=UPI001E4130E1|nr:hypothetical protein [Halobacterium noricense]UHH25412.1 hypothetical protein LT974_00345 [Halobacterium noricense]
MSERCEGCGDSVRVAGGIGDIWTMDPTGTGGMTLEFTDVQESQSDSCTPSEARSASEDDSEFFLCFDCIDALPDEPGAGDVAALGEQ